MLFVWKHPSRACFRCSPMFHKKINFPPLSCFIVFYLVRRPIRHSRDGDGGSLAKADRAAV